MMRTLLLAAAAAASAPAVLAAKLTSRPQECVLIDATSGCAPYNNYGVSINLTALNKNYGLVKSEGQLTTAAQWDAVIRQLSMGGPLLQSSLGSYAGCRNYKGGSIQFLATYMCIYDIFYVSAGCNDNYSTVISSADAAADPPICVETCDHYSEALESLFADPEACPDDPTAHNAKQFELNRDEMRKGRDICKAILTASSSASSNAKNSDTCVYGVQSDLDHCGFGGNKEAADALCKATPGHACCEASVSSNKDAGSPTKFVPSKDTSNNTPKTTDANCIDLSSSTACAPFNKGYYFDLAAVQEKFPDIVDAKTFDKAVLEFSTGGESLISALSSEDTAACTGYLGAPIQFMLTEVCVRLILQDSASCNPGEKPADHKVCGSTCQMFADALQSMLDDEPTCPSDASKSALTFRKNMIKSSKHCAQTVSKTWPSSSSSASSYDDCFTGVDLDLSTCGFATNQDAAKAFCADRPEESCCSAIGTKPPSRSVHLSSNDASDMTKVQSKASFDDFKDNSKSFYESHQVLVISLSVVLVLLVIGMIVCCVVLGKRRSQRNRNNRVASFNGTAAKETVPLNGAAAPMGQIADYKQHLSQGQPVVPASVGQVTFYKAVYPYNPQLSDELELRPGDVVEVSAIYDDGWSKGENTRTHATGTFPMAVVKPL